MNQILQFFSDNFWATATALGTISTFICGEINGRLKPNAIWRQVIAWFVAVALTVGTYFLNVVTVQEPVWLTLTATGIVVGLVSNGVYDIPFMKNLMKRLFGETIVALQSEKKEN